MAEMALAKTEDAGVIMPHAMCRIASAQVAFEKGDHQRAFSVLDAAEACILSVGAQYLELTCHLVRAYFNYCMGMETDGTRALARGMELARQKGFTDAPVLWRPPVMTRLCAEALKAGIEVEYVQNLIRRKGLVPDARAMELENWPWPVQVFTLGEFRLVLDGKPVEFSGKVQERPLALLKAVIAHGGKNVPEGQLCDLLWYGADGDAAYRSYATNLHRLRKLLGNDKAVISRGGRVTLNQSLVWTDALVFEKLSCNIKQQESVGEGPGPLFGTLPGGRRQCHMVCLHAGTAPFQVPRYSHGIGTWP
jgi:hypothetical protein